MKKLLTILTAFALPVFANAAVKQGDVEADFQISYSNLDAEGSDLSLLLTNANVGYFVTDGMELGASLTWLEADLDGDDLSAVLLGTGIDYHFATSSGLVPYVGAGAYYAEADLDGDSVDGWAWEVRAGLKQFVAENVAIKYQISYIDFDLDDVNIDGINVGVGLAIFF